MSGADLQRVVDMLGSTRMESQFQLLRAGTLLDELRRVVAIVHGHAAVRKGANRKLIFCIMSLSARLGDVLEAVLRRQTRAEAWHQVPAFLLGNRVFRRDTIRQLRQSLHDFKVLESYLLGAYDADVVRHEGLSGGGADVHAPPRVQAAGGPMLGRRKLVEKMVSVLLADRAQAGEAADAPAPLVVPIVGGPGVGKTRLAQAVFLDDRVRSRFDVRRWVHVSPHPHLAKMMAMISPAKRPPRLEYTTKTIKILIRHALLGCSYLLVLDDVWNDTPGGSLELDSLIGHLPPHGKIILTTRIPAVVSRMATTTTITIKPIYLQPLGEKLSFSLARRWTSCLPLPDDGDCGGCPSEIIQEAALMIAKKCGGVPFLLEYACRLLCLPQLDMNFWLRFMEDETNSDPDHVWGRLPGYIDMLPEEMFWQRFLHHFHGLPGADVILDSAFVSYQHLLFDLRGCLLYCSLFPSDYVFDAEQLADLLAVEGFIPPTVSESQRRGFLQVLFDECFHPLQESLHGGSPSAYRMHKMLHIFAQSMEREFITVSRAGQVTWITSRARARSEHSVRHVSLIVHPLIASLPGDWSAFKDLRTLVLIHQGEIRLPDQPRCEVKVIPHMLCQSLEHLQVLSLKSMKIDTIPRNFEMLSSLRYLNLSRSEIETIPRSVSRLQYLQVLILSHCEMLKKLHKNTAKLSRLQKLDLEGCCHLVELPQNMTKMKSLEYLNVLDCSLLSQMPQGVGQLKNLSTLLGYVASCNDGRAISELHSLANLHRLCLDSLDKIMDPEEARYAQLDRKRYLESLQLRWNMEAENNSATAYAVLETLRPPRHLKTLEIVAYEGENFPTWMRSRHPYLSSLVEIRLVNLKACERTLPPLGLLPRLKIAEISGAKTISCIDNGFYGLNGTFRSLEKLILSFMPSLEVWEKAQSDSRETIFPCLTELTIIQCPRFRALHMELPAVEKLILWMNNKMLYSSKGALAGVVRSLEHVSVSFCEELLASSDCEALQELAGLEKLDICGCHGLRCIPQGLQHLSSLRRLTVDNCSNLEKLPSWLKNLPNLQLVYLSGCPMLQSIPQEVRECHNIDIIVEDCPNLPGPSEHCSYIEDGLVSTASTKCQLQTYFYIFVSFSSFANSFIICMNYYFPFVSPTRVG